jgi:hypothetical protein
MSYARIGYDAYRSASGGTTYDGRPMPTWDELEALPHGERTRRLWEAAAMAIGEAADVGGVEARRAAFMQRVREVTEEGEVFVLPPELISPHDDSTPEGRDQLLADGIPCRCWGYCCTLLAVGFDADGYAWCKEHLLPGRAAGEPADLLNVLRDARKETSPEEADVASWLDELDAGVEEERVEREAGR